jgi:hypothetical protein
MANYTQYSPGIVTLDLSSSGFLLIGTAGAEIYLENPVADIRFKCILQGHFSGEVWGCAVHPSKK